MVAGKTGKYHLYRRSLKDPATGAVVKAWYYWYTDTNGTQVRKSCGQSKAVVTLRREAEERIAKLEVEDAAAANLATRSRATRLQDIAETMYLEGSKHMRLRDDRGDSLTETTRKECRSYLERVILPRWGGRIPSEIGMYEIEDWLLEFDRSASWKNRIIEILGEVFDECLRIRLVKAKPIPERLKRKTEKKDILTGAEIRRLFPAEREKLEAVWRLKDPREKPNAGLMYGALFATILGCGLRSGEARAISPRQIDIEHHGLFVDQSIDSAGKLVEHLKKGHSEDPRYRVVVIPDRVLEALKWWLKERKAGRDEYLFEFREKPVSKDLLRKRFDAGLANAGIKVGDRRLTPHSLRYTYVTRMRRIVSKEALQSMSGHRSDEMTDLYTRAELEEQLAALQTVRPQLEAFWS